MKYIDIANIFKNSDSKLLKKLPRFIVKLMAKIIHENEINQILTKYSNDIGINFLSKMINELNLTVEIEGYENLPENGNCFFCANHPFGIIDGLILTNTVAEKYGNLKAIGNEAFMFVPNLRPLIAVVNVYGRTQKEYITELEKIFASKIPLTHFPAGEVSRRYKGKIQDREWQKSVISKAVLHKRDIVPFYFYGKNSFLFYLISDIRKILRIKTNLELVLLPREMFKKRNKTIKVKIGKPIISRKFDKSLSHKVRIQKVRKYVYELRQNHTNNINF